MTSTNKIIKRSVKHNFTPSETANLHVEFTQAYNNLGAVQKEFDSVKASYKAKESEAESRMASLNATLQAGFEIRDKSVAQVLDFKDGKKYFYVVEALPEGWEKIYTTPESWPKSEAVIVESITDADRQEELIAAEARFEKREEIELFSPSEKDNGVLIVGRLGGKWFSALRVQIGAHVLEQRLDGEQSCSKKRADQIKRGLKDFVTWVEEKIGREEAKGFKNAVELVKATHSEREE